ncbi:MAG: PHP domain-containing protein, partial [Candidatus Binatia bacterium]
MDDLFDPPGPILGSGRPPYQSPGARKEKLRERRYLPQRGGAPLPYAELRAASAFSFLDGASLPEDLVARAAELALPAVALVDRNGVYGAPRFWKAAKAAGLKPLVGAEVTFETQNFLFRNKEEESKGKSFHLRERQEQRQSRKDFRLGERREAEGRWGRFDGASGGDPCGTDGAIEAGDAGRSEEAPATRDPS